MSASDSTPPPTSPVILETLQEGIDHPLDPRYVILQRLTGWISAAVTSVLLFAILSPLFAISQSRALTYLLPVTWIVVSAANAWWQQKRPAMEYEHSSYRVDAGGIRIQRGIFWRTVITVPRSRVQHTEVSQGPLERRHGLGTLTIHTAGASHATVSLPGLVFERALLIRDFLLPRDHGDDV
jgi:membrane protein YdbS with pleckstrin-like domain